MTERDAGGGGDGCPRTVSGGGQQPAASGVPDARRGADAPHDPILAEAAAWLARLQEGPLDATGQQALAAWCAQGPAHQRAWQRAQRLLASLDGMPPGLARTVLDARADALVTTGSRWRSDASPAAGQADGAEASSPQAGRAPGAGRRRVRRHLGMLLLATPLGWLAWQQRHRLSGLGARHITPHGQVQHLTLADGSQITLNADSRLDEDFNDSERLLILRRGEVFVETARDPQALARPFRVRTAQGMVQALGTRFSVRQLADSTWLALHQGAVRVSPAGLPAEAHVLLPAGQQLRFSADHIEAPRPVADSSSAWRHGLLVAHDLPLPDWAEQLGRFSGRPIRVLGAARRLRLSGTFPLRDPDQALRMLAATHRVRIRPRAGGVDIDA